MRKYAPDFRLRAIALAEVRSIPIASRDLGVPVDTLTRWVEEEPPTPALERAVNLALSELTGRIADGTIKGRDLTVAYGVLRDKWARYGKVESNPEPQTFGDDWWAALEPRLVELGHDRDLALVALIHRGDSLDDDGLLQHGRDYPDDPDEWEPQYLALSAKERASVVRGVVDADLAYLAGLGDLDEWHERDRAEHSRQSEAQIVKNAAVKAAWERKALDAETQRLIEAAEAYLRETAQ